jgi:uncharacterized protein YeeX (DUF496 family)
MRLSEYVNEDPDIRAIDTIIDYLSYDCEKRHGFALTLTNQLKTLRESIEQDILEEHRDYEGELADHEIKSAKEERLCD